MDERKTLDFNSAAAENQIISEFEEFQARAILKQINAVPLRDNLYEWHFNLFPRPKKGRIPCAIHGCLKFDRNPRVPPIIEILSPQFQHPKIVTLNGHNHVNILEDGEKAIHVNPTEILRRLWKLFDRAKLPKDPSIPHCICGHDENNQYPSKGKSYVFQHVVAPTTLMQQNVDVSNKANQFKDCMIKSVLVDYGKVFYKALIRDMKIDTATPVRLGWGFPKENPEDWEKQEFYGCLFGTTLEEPGGGYFLHKIPWGIKLNLPLQTGFQRDDIVTVGVDFENSKFLFAVNDFFIGEVPFPDFMQGGHGFYPVAGVLQSSVQMIFQGPPPEVEQDRFSGFMSVREYMESDRGAYWWKHGVQYHWIDFFAQGLPYEGDQPPEFDLQKRVKRVFEFLSAPDLRRAMEVNPVFRDIIQRSTLLQQASLFCHYTRKRYSDPNTVLGLMLDVRKPNKARRETSLSIVSVTASHDFLTMESWETGRVRNDSSSRKEYSHFLPVILNEKHGDRAFQHLPKYLGEILGKSGNATVVESFEALAALMNGCVQTLANGFDPFQPPTIQLQEETLSLFSHLYHLMLFLASEHPQLVDHATKKCTEFVKAADPDSVPPLHQLGILIAYLFILPDEINWHTIRRQYVNEIWARDVPSYLSKKRDLENPGYPMENRVRDVWESTKASTRTYHTLLFSFFAVFYRRSNRLEELNNSFGSPNLEWHEQLRNQCESITEMSSWKDYFKNMSSGHPPQQQFGRMLYDALQVALRRGYIKGKQSQQRGQNSYQNGYPRQMGPRQPGRGSPRGQRGQRGRGMGRGGRGMGRGRGFVRDQDYERREREMPMRNTPNGRFDPITTRGPPARPPTRGGRREPRRGQMPRGARPPTRGARPPPRTGGGRFNLNQMSGVIYEPKTIDSFDKLPNTFQSSLRSGNIKGLKPLQENALGVMTGGGSVQVVAPVGSGKATVAALAALYRLFSQQNAIVLMLCADNIRCGVLSNLIQGLTFEFPAIKVIEQCKGSRFLKPQDVRSGRAIIVGTNGRVQDMMTRFEGAIGNVVKQNLVGVFVMDADFTLHSTQMNRTQEVFQHIHASIPCSIFSNSWCPALDRASLRVKGEMDYTPIIEDAPVEPRYWFVSCDNVGHRFDIICDLIEQNPLGSCVVFCNQQKRMQEVVDTLQSRGSARKKVLECTLENARENADKLRSGRADVLVSTDYGSPGISNCGSRVLINFEIGTRDFETFKKRIGLLKPSADGPIHVINLILSSDTQHKYWQDLEQELQVSLSELEHDLRTVLV